MGSRFISVVHGHRPHGTDLETRFLCSVSTPAQFRIRISGTKGTISPLVRLIKEADFILMPPSWWPTTPCPRQHGWWVRIVDSIHANPMLEMIWHGSDFVPGPYF
jgi:hypothetical protein